MSNPISEYLTWVDTLSPNAKEIHTFLYDTSGRPNYDYNWSCQLEDMFWLLCFEKAKNYEEFNRIVKELQCKDKNSVCDEDIISKWNLLMSVKNKAKIQVKREIYENIVGPVSDEKWNEIVKKSQLPLTNSSNVIKCAGEQHRRTDMPNWCQNNITIEAPTTELQRLVNAGLEKKVLGTVYPMPSTVYRGNLGKEEFEKYPGQQNWYDWSKANWGTKWDAHADRMDVLDGVVSIGCDTAWGPPLQAFVNYTRNNKAKVTIEYVELGMWFKGRAVIFNGEILEDVQSKPEAGVDYDPDDYED